MKIIKTLLDLRNLRESEDVSDEVLNYFEEYLRDLVKPLAGNVPVEDFTLEEHGYFVLLEGDSDLQEEEMKKVGLSEGFLNTNYEFIEEVELTDQQLYKVSVLYTNDYMMQFFLRPEDFSQEVRDWLEHNSVSIEDYLEEINIDDVPF